MHPRAAEFVERARETYGVEWSVREFPEGTKTAADAAAAVGCAVEQIASSLVFDVDGDLVVAITSGGNRVDEARLAAHFGGETATMASPERISEDVGWAIGGVPPVCHDADLPVVLDPTLTDFETVWAAAGTPEAVFPVDPDELRRLADAEVMDVTG